MSFESCYRVTQVDTAGWGFVTLPPILGLTLAIADTSCAILSLDAPSSPYREGRELSQRVTALLLSVPLGAGLSSAKWTRRRSPEAHSGRDAALSVLANPPVGAVRAPAPEGFNSYSGSLMA